MPEPLPQSLRHQAADRFAQRHIGPDGPEIAAMLAALGLDSIDALLSETVPRSIADPELALPAAVTETQVTTRLRELADRNRVVTSLIGTGYCCLLYTSPSPRDATLSRMPSSA